MANFMLGRSLSKFFSPSGEITSAPVERHILSQCGTYLRPSNTICMLTLFVISKNNLLLRLIVAAWHRCLSQPRIFDPVVLPRRLDEAPAFAREKLCPELVFELLYPRRHVGRHAVETRRRMAVDSAYRAHRGISRRSGYGIERHRADLSLVVTGVTL